MNVKVIHRSFQPLYGQPCWGLSHARYVNLSMNFGKPSLQVREPYNTDSKSEVVRRTAATAAGYCSWGMVALDLVLPLATDIGRPCTGDWFFLIPAS